VPVRMAVLALVASVAAGQAMAATRDLSSVSR